METDWVYPDALSLLLLLYLQNQHTHTHTRMHAYNDKHGNQTNRKFRHIKEKSHNYLLLCPKSLLKGERMTNDGRMALNNTCHDMMRT